MCENKVISISDILRVINHGPPSIIDQKAAKLGIEMHGKLTRAFVDGEIPPRLQKAGVTLPIEPGKKVNMEVGNNLNLTAIPDLIGNEFTIEIKKGPISGRTLIQTAGTCLARGAGGEGVVYLYGDGKTYVLPDGGKCVEAHINILAQNARRILDIQELLDNRPKGLIKHPKLERETMVENGLFFRKPPCNPERIILGRESVKLGEQVDDLALDAYEKLKGNLMQVR